MAGLPVQAARVGRALMLPPGPELGALAQTVAMHRDPLGTALTRLFGCLGEHLAKAYVDALERPIRRRIRLRPLWPSTERMVLRGTILVPHRSAPTRAERR
jgi:hypothetical protein